MSKGIVHKDICGRELKVGDVVVIADQCGSSAVHLKVGVISRLTPHMFYVAERLYESFQDNSTELYEYRYKRSKGRVLIIPLSTPLSKQKCQQLDEVLKYLN